IGHYRVDEFSSGEVIHKHNSFLLIFFPLILTLASQVDCKWPPNIAVCTENYHCFTHFELLFPLFLLPLAPLPRLSLLLVLLREGLSPRKVIYTKGTGRMHAPYISLK